MDFGKLPPNADLDRVDFRLPKPDERSLERTARVLGRTKGEGAARVHVGAPIWSQKQWLGKVYPLGSKPQDFLSLYSRQFNGIELNTTHYHIPTPEAVDAWVAQTPEGFRFCPKFPQEISHHRELEHSEPLVAMFCDSIARLGSRLGTSFVQLSPGFAPDRLPVLKRFLAQVQAHSPEFPVCVEFRHPKWFERPGHLLPAALDALEETGAGTVITDTAGRRDVVHADLSVSRAMFRFVGNELHSSDYSRVDAWVERISSWLGQGLRDLHFFVHQPENDVAPELISHLVSRLNTTGLARVEDWKRMDQGTQLSMF